MPRRIFLFLTLFAAAAILAHAKPENWLEVRSPHFILLSDSNEKQARHVADQFERMRSVFQAVFPHAQVDPASPIVVLAVKDKKDFQALEPAAYLAKGQLDLAGLFLRAPDKNYVLLRLDAAGEHPYSTVYHEYTHLLSSKAELPLWLDEGLAEFYETTEIRDKEVLLGQPSTDILLFLRQNRLIPLTTLFSVDHNSPYYHEENKGNIFYAESWALTHYLEMKDFQERTHRVTDFADLVRLKVDPVTAATRAFGDLKQLQAALEKYVGQGSFTYIKKAGSTEVDDSAFKVQAVSLSQADAVRADFLAYDQRVADARTLLDRVLHDDPNNVSAHETMGYLAFREGKLDEARKWYEQAVTLDSQSFLAQYYFAAISLTSGQPDSNRWPQIEASLRAAIKLNPSFAPAYDELVVFYGMQRQNLVEAYRLAVNAVQLEPGNVSYRLHAANILLEMGRGTDAIAVLRIAGKLAKTPEESTSVQNLLESAQQYMAAREGAEQENPEIQSSATPGQSSAQTTAGDAGAPESAPPVLQHRDEEPHGPQSLVNGTLKDVKCFPPAIMDLKVENAAGTISLHSSNYYKILFTAVNYMPGSELHPCTELEGMKAQVKFFEALDKSAAGRIVSVELIK
jgi:tetratricopeptide (TPR) repeat protein